MTTNHEPRTPTTCTRRSWPNPRRWSGSSSATKARSTSSRLEYLLCERIFLAGIGTSHHASLVGEHLMRAYGGGPDVRAVHSFDLALYGPELRREDCVVAVSHRGAKRYTALALEQAREKGCPTALITGEAGSGEGRADAVFRTVAQERSPAHTVSYTTAVAVLALLAGRVGYHRSRSDTLPYGLLREELPEALRAALGTEEEVAAFAREHVGRRRIWLLGGGRAR